MNRGSIAVAVCVSLLAGGGAVYCHQRDEALQEEARWLMLRGKAQAEEYARRLEDLAADEQLRLFARRRAVLERAHVWQRGQLLGVMVAALGLAAAYALWVLKRLEEQLLDAVPELDASEAGPSPCAPPLASEVGSQR